MIKKNYNVVSALRIIACFLIVREHYFSIFQIPSVLKKINLTGVGPVAIFFVLSGFLAYISLSENKSAREYYIKRICRVVPSYYLVLFICIIFLSVTKGIGADVMHVGWLRYFSFLNMLIPSFSFYEWNNLYGFWTMGCFPVFYLLAPLLFRRMGSLKSSLELLCITMVGMVMGREIIIGVLSAVGFDNIVGFATLNPFCTLYLFVLGGVSAYCYERDEIKEGALFLGAIFLGMLILDQSGYILWGIATAIILLKPSLKFDFEEKRIIKEILHFFDRNSFNIYLLHNLVSEIWIYIMKSSKFIDGIVCGIITLIMAEILSILTVKISKCLKPIFNLSS